MLEVRLDDGRSLRIPRRALWDVRLQLMAEAAPDDDPDDLLGAHDVKTGVYEGGFKSWESSADLVAVLAAHYPAPWTLPARIIETIYSPLALQAFRDMVLSVLERDPRASAWVAAKRLYFGVGGSLDDFVAQLRHRGLAVHVVREENDGVSRRVVRCRRAPLPLPSGGVPAGG
ncbi:hypothetical protein E4U53_003967 [Claviceps sorghi]|nr:hypothetical protein E4U53_003967 [Claviceps sorghi]